MGLESVTYITDLVSTNPVGSTDTKSTLDDHIRNIKKGLLNTFPNFTGIAMTSTEAELNGLDGLTASRAIVTNGSGILSASAATSTEVGYLSGVTSAIQTQLDAKYAPSGTDVAVADGGTGSSTAAGARTNLGLGTLSTLNSVSQSEIDASAVGRGELKTATVTTLAGTITAGAGVNITLNSYAFFPMIHVGGTAGADAVRLTGHTVDGASPDNPRFRFYNTDGVNDANYDVEYRYVDA